jgi:hypothetical protein
MMVLGGGGFGRGLGHEDGALRDGISTLIKRPQRAFSPSFYHGRTSWSVAVYESGSTLTRN